MNRLIRTMFAFLPCLAVALLAPGCSPVVNMPDDGMIMPDSGMPNADGSTNRDDAVPTDRITPPTDGDPPTDSGGMACQPTDADPTCSGASSCSCLIDPMLMPAICSEQPEMMPVCAMGMTCMPGVNHCTPHFPPGVNAAPFECEDHVRNGTWGSNRVIFGFRTVNGIFQVGGIHSDFDALYRVAACSGTSCYGLGYLASQMPMQVQFMRIDFHSFTGSPCGEACVHNFPLGTIPSATDVTANPTCLPYAGPR